MKPASPAASASTTRVAAAGCFVAACLAACSPGSAHERSGRASPGPTPPLDIEALLDLPTLSDLALSRQGDRALVTSDVTGTPRPLLIDLATGARQPAIAATGGSLHAVSWFPDGERFLLSGDRDGNEQVHLYVASAGGRARDLTPGTGRRAIFLGWASDGRSFFVSDNERDPRYADIFRVAVADFEREELFRDTVGLQFGAISGDGRRIALLRPTAQVGGTIWIADTGRGTLTRVPGQPEDASAVPRAFDPDGLHLYATSNEASDFARLERVDVETGARTVVFEPGWDVTDARVIASGAALLAFVDEDARTRLHRVPFGGPDGAATPVGPAGRATVTEAAVTQDGERIVFLATTGRTPPRLHVLDTEDDAGLRVPAGADVPDLDLATLVEPAVVRFRSYDGLEIPAVLYRPIAADAGAPVPVILWAHGGPGGQARIGFSPLFQYLVSHGYAVLAVNNRGSTGYGKRFASLDDGRHGDADLDDYVAAKRWLAGEAWARADRVAIMGSSYGGFLVLAALAFRPDEFRAGVDLYGISNWVRTVENIPPWWEPFRPALERELGPFDDLEAFRARSPAFHADRIVRPLMVLQGANDPRVLPAESEEIVREVRARGVTVRYLLFEDEGHGFEKRENRIEAYRGIREFLDRHLRPGR